MFCSCPAAHFHQRNTLPGMTSEAVRPPLRAGSQSRARAGYWVARSLKPGRSCLLEQYGHPVFLEPVRFITGEVYEWPDAGPMGMLCGPRSTSFHDTVPCTLAFPAPPNKSSRECFFSTDRDVCGSSDGSPRSCSLTSNMGPRYKRGPTSPPRRSSSISRATEMPQGRQRLYLFSRRACDETDLVVTTIVERGISAITCRGPRARYPLQKCEGRLLPTPQRKSPPTPRT